MRAPRTGGKGVIVLSVVFVCAWFVMQLALLLTVAGLVSPMWSSACLCLRCPCKSASLSLVESSVVEKAACCSDKVSSLESSLSELDNKVLGALAVSSGRNWLVFAPNCKVAVLNLNVWLKVLWFQSLAQKLL